MNPARNNSGYTWEDAGDDIYFQGLRKTYNMEADLELELKDIDLVPLSPQRLGHVIDAYDGHDTGTTSGIRVRKIGTPQFKCGFRNELN